MIPLDTQDIKLVCHNFTNTFKNELTTYLKDKHLEMHVIVLISCCTHTLLKKRYVLFILLHLAAMGN